MVPIQNQSLVLNLNQLIAAVELVSNCSEKACQKPAKPPSPEASRRLRPQPPTTLLQLRQPISQYGFHVLFQKAAAAEAVKKLKKHDRGRGTGTAWRISAVFQSSHCISVQKEKGGGGARCHGVELETLKAGKGYDTYRPGSLLPPLPVAMQNKMQHLNRTAAPVREVNRPPPPPAADDARLFRCVPTDAPAIPYPSQHLPPPPAPAFQTTHICRHDCLPAFCSTRLARAPAISCNQRVMPPKKPQTVRPSASVGDSDVDMAAALGRSTMESLQKVFERLDRKNDGKIDKEELMQQFENLGCVKCTSQ